MAWTTPRTWVTSEIITCGMFNTHVKKNILHAVTAYVSGESVDTTTLISASSIYTHTIAIGKKLKKGKAMICSLDSPSNGIIVNFSQDESDGVSVSHSPGLTATIIKQSSGYLSDAIFTTPGVHTKLKDIKLLDNDIVLRFENTVASDVVLNMACNYQCYGVGE